MLKALSKEWCWVYILLLVITALFFRVRPVMANMGYSVTWQTDELVSGEVIQSYNQAAFVGAGQEFTPFLSTVEFIRYGQRWVTHQEVNKTLSSDLQGRIKNYIFSLDAKASTVRDLSVASYPERTTYELEGVSLWQKAYWPNLRTSLTQSESSDHLSPKRINTLSHSLFSTIDWNLRAFNLVYTLRADKEGNVDTGLERNQVSQSANISAGHSLWGKRLKFHVAQDFKRDAGSREAKTDMYGVAYLDQLISQVRTGTDTTPSDGIDDPVHNNSMRDGVLETPAYTVHSNTSDNSIIIRVSGQEVGMIYLYTDQLFRGSTSSLLWRLFSTDILGSGWREETLGSLSAQYDSVNKRFIIPIGNLQNNYLKIMVQLRLNAPDISFSEVVALQVKRETTGTIVSTDSEQKSSATSFGFDLEFLRNFSLGYDLQVTEEQSDPGIDSNSLYHSSKLQYKNPVWGTSGSLSAGSSQVNQIDRDDYENNNLSFNLSQTFLPTLFGSIGWSRSDNITAGELISTTDLYSFYGNAQLYPDLQSQFGLKYAQREDFLSKNDTENYTADFGITSRLKPSLVLSLNESYDRQKTQAKNIDQLNSSLTMSWQLSRAFSWNGTASYAYQKDSDDSLSMTSAFSLAVGRNIQTFLRYYYFEQSQIDHRGEMSLAWGINNNLSLKLGMLYLNLGDGTENEFRFDSTLSARFSIR
ncbi:MAG: hypothetical protein KJ950_04220 [Proteobacteria bacterium]|nr:hypothetical protein [Pseudomonadota bacterium]MBU1688471.1 hypothetical protein [Pseudomonadota bacterium]